MLKRLLKKEVISPFLMILLLFIFINYLASSLSTLFYPYDVDYSEGFILTPSIRLLNRKNLYQDVNISPFSIINYTPIFFFVNSFTMILFGENLFSAKLISFISSIAIGYLIYLIVYKQSKKKFISIVSSLIFFSSFVTFFAGPLAKVDLLAALFSILGIYFIGQHKKRKNFFLAIIFFILSVFTKQTFIAAPIASFIYLLTEDRKKGLRFLSFFVLSTLVISFLINTLSQGQFFLHLIKYSVGVLTFDYNLFNYLFLANLIILCVAIFYFFRKPKTLLSLYFVLSLIIVIIELMRAGGSIYYFFELTIITSILTGLLLNDFRSNPDRKFFLIFIIFLQLILFIQADSRILLFIFKPNDYPPLVNQVTDGRISTYVKNSTGNVLVEHATFARLNGKKIPPEPSSVYELEKNNILDSSEVMKFYENQDYSLIIYYSRLNLVQGLRDYIEKNYELIDKLNWRSLEGVDWSWKVYEKK